MKMTLKQFIEGSGVPVSDTYVENTGSELYSRYFNCVLDECYIKRDELSNPVKRLRRKLYYDFGLGRIPIKSETFNHKFLYWGSVESDYRIETLKSLLTQLGTFSINDYFIILTTGTDDAFTAEHARFIPGSVKKIFVTNSDVNHLKVQWYPIGRDPANEPFFNIPPAQNKSGLVYCNFSLGTHAVRKRVYDLLAGKEFVTDVRIDGYGQDSGYPMSPEAFLSQLNSHLFSICPRGNGIDSFRMWDSLHLGVVPIVVREAQFHELLNDLPILFLDEVEQFGDLTRGFLEKTHAKMMDTQYDFSMLCASYWQQLMDPLRMMNSALRDPMK